MNSPFLHGVIAGPFVFYSMKGWFVLMGMLSQYFTG